jgi:hypothetical protein
VVAGIDDVVIGGIHPVTVVPLFLWLTRPVVAQLRAGVDLVVYLVVMASPVSNFHFVVGVESTRVVDTDLAIFVRRACVALP